LKFNNWSEAGSREDIFNRISHAHQLVTLSYNNSLPGLAHYYAAACNNNFSPPSIDQPPPVLSATNHGLPALLTTGRTDTTNGLQRSYRAIAVLLRAISGP